MYIIIYKNNRISEKEYYEFKTEEELKTWIVENDITSQELFSKDPAVTILKGTEVKLEFSLDEPSTTITDCYLE